MNIKRRFYTAAPIAAFLTLAGCGGVAFRPQLPQYEVLSTDYSGTNVIAGFDVSLKMEGCLVEFTFKNESRFPSKILLAESSIQAGSASYPVVAYFPNEGDRFGIRSPRLDEVVIPPNTQVRAYLHPRTAVDSTGHWGDQYLCPADDVYHDAKKRESYTGWTSRIQLMLTQMDKRVFATWGINLKEWVPNPLCKTNPEKCSGN